MKILIYNKTDDEYMDACDDTYHSENLEELSTEVTFFDSTEEAIEYILANYFSKRESLEIHEVEVKVEVINKLVLKITTENI